MLIEFILSIINVKVNNYQHTIWWYMDYKKSFTDYLRLTSRKMTLERHEILGVFISFAKNKDFGKKKHFNAKDLSLELKAVGSPLSIATIYRSLPIFCDAGIIKEVAKRCGKMLYELVTDEQHHDHLVCLRCGRVIEFHSEVLEDLQRQICKELDFEISEHYHCIKGKCQFCRDKPK